MVSIAQDFYTESKELDLVFRKLATLIFQEYSVNPKRDQIYFNISEGVFHMSGLQYKNEYYHSIQIQEITSTELVDEISAIHKALLPDALFATFTIGLGRNIYHRLISDPDVKVIGAFELANHQLVGAGIFQLPKFSILPKSIIEIIGFLIQLIFWIPRKPGKILKNVLTLSITNNHRPEGIGTVISAIYVLPDYQRQGISSRILEFAETFTSPSKLFVSTTPTNFKALAFYQKQGFNVASEGKNFVWLKK
jgi:ribosomal protein S18 acetylase RimI-like enzyme